MQSTWRGKGRQSPIKCCTVLYVVHSINLILGGHSLGVVGVRCQCELDLNFDLAILTLSNKILSGYISKTVRSRKVLLCRDIGWGL